MKARRAFRNFIFFVIDVLYVGFIFGNSLKQGDESALQSKPFAEFFEKILVFFNNNITYSEVEHYIRKTAHFLEFFLLGLLLFFSFAAKYYRVNYIKPLVYKTLGLGLTVCSVDEFLQLFVPGRSASPVDVLINFSGILISFTIGLLYLKAKKAAIKRKK